MRAAVCIIVWLLTSIDLIAATPCTTYDVALVSHPSTIATSAIMSTWAATINTGRDMTIGITNRYGSQLSLSFGLDAGYPPPLNDPQPTVLPDSSSTQYIYPTGWAGRVGVGPNLSPYGSKIEGSFTGPPDVDVSYVDGYTVPITCSSRGKAITGCNIDLFKRAACGVYIDGPVCRNFAVNLANGPPPCFFAPCIGAAYTYPSDDDANASNLTSNLISCCIGTSCEPPSRQLPKNTCVPCLSQITTCIGSS